MKTPPTCQWCLDTFPTLTAKLIHLHEEHPETIGRGHTISVHWTCPPPCNTPNTPTVYTCRTCRTTNTEREAAYHRYTWQLFRRRPDGTVQELRSSNYQVVTDVLRLIPSLHARLNEPPVTYDADRNRVLNADGRQAYWIVGTRPTRNPIPSTQGETP